MTLCGLTVGAKVQHRVSSSEWWFEHGGSKYSVREDAEGAVAGELPGVIAPLYRHSQESLRKCKDIEMAVTGLETQGSGSTCFPIVAGKRHKFGGRHHHHHQPSGGKHRDEGGKGHSWGREESSDKRRESSSAGKGHSWDHESPQTSLSNLCPPSPSLLQFPDSVKVCGHNSFVPTLMLFPPLQQMPSYPGTPGESSFQSTTLGSVRGGSQAAEGGRDHSSGRNQPAADAVIRSVQVTGTCKAVQVSGTIALHQTP